MVRPEVGQQIMITNTRPQHATAKLIDIAVPSSNELSKIRRGAKHKPPNLHNQSLQQGNESFTYDAYEVWNNWDLAMTRQRSLAVLSVGRAKTSKLPAQTRNS